MSETLSAAYSGFISDLDGVVRRGEEPVEYAVEALRQLRAGGKGVVYATNNASTPPAVVADHLRSLGVELSDDDVLTSSMAGAAHLAGLLDEGSLVLVVGGEGVRLALESVGLTPVLRADVDALTEPIAAVLQGLGHEVNWKDLAEAAFHIQQGATWVATNSDPTLPTSRGQAPGNGALVAAVRSAVDHDPIVVGKPETPLYELCASVLGTEVAQTLAIGDRLDTDIEGAGKAGIPSLYVATGVSTPIDVILADGHLRPTFLATDLRALEREYVAATVNTESGTTVATCGGARVEYADRLVFGDDEGTPDERLRAVVAAGWAVRDSGAHLESAALAGVLPWIRQGVEE